jgi:hypothetical protein
MIEHLIKLAAKLEAEGNRQLAEKVKRIIASDGKDLKGELSAKELMGILPESARKHFVNQLIDTLNFTLNFDTGELGTTVNAVPSIKDGETDGMPLGYTSNLPGVEKYMKTEEDVPAFEGGSPEDIDTAFGDITHIEKEEVKDIRKDLTFPPKDIDEAVRSMDQEAKATLMTKLVKIADKLDREGKFELAARADEAIANLHSDLTIVADGTVGLGDPNPKHKLNVVEAARPKAPLKNLKDDVKKNLVLFVIDADKNLSKGVGGLKELFRRLRYFDLADTVKDIGLDRVVKEMEKTQNCLDTAKRDLYTVTFGKRPSEKDLEELIKELTDDNADNNDDGQSALDFFDSQSSDDEDDKSTSDEEDEPTSDEEDMAALHEAGPEFAEMMEAFTAPIDDEDDESEDLLSDFWADDDGGE